MIKQSVSELTSKNPEFEACEDLRLIDGDFDVQEAKEILMNLINHKIHFHQLKNFSTEVRTGEPNKHSQTRLKELMKDRERLTAVLDYADQNELRIRVRSNIEICLTK